MTKIKKMLEVGNKPSTIRRVLRWGIRILAGLIVIHYGLGIAASPLSAPVQIIAHRGGPAYHPENTLAAFEQAIADGVDWLEFDVQMTADGHLVVIHDETVDRTTDGTGAVADLTLAEIQALDAGSGERVPTFEEVIALAKAAGVGILPEAKSPHLYDGIEEKMAQAIVAAGYVDGTIVQSFDADSLDRFQQIDPRLTLCSLYGLWGLSADEDQPGDAEVICPMAEMVLLNPGIIRQAHADGRHVFVWFGVLENPIMMRLMLAFGADGLMVDDQGELIAILRP